MKMTPVLLIAAALAGLATTAQGKPWWLRDTDTNDSDFLPPDVAFRSGAAIEGQALRIRWVIADGYYLYKDKIVVQAESPDLSLGRMQLPPGIMKTDPFLGRQEIYTQQVEARVPFTRADYGAHPLQIRVTYQGCAEAGLCYPPITKVLFPAAALPESSVNAPRQWQIIAIIGGILAFLAAGFVLRQERKLALPAP